MSTTQKPQKAYLFVDYVPAVLKENSIWIVEYYVKNPFTGELQRKRNRVRPISNKTERRKLAKRMCFNINNKLENGWNPFVTESNAKSFTKINEAFDIYTSQIKKRLQKNEIRFDSVRAYKSYIKNIIGFLESKDKLDDFITTFDEQILNEFLTHIYYDRNTTARTHNNYMRFIKIYCKWLVKYRYISINPSVNLSKITEGDKTRTVIPVDVRNKIFEHLKEDNITYYTLCLFAFYCLVRRTEITKLKVDSVILKNNIIYITNNQSKNHKNFSITITNELKPFISVHIKNAEKTDFLFSGDNFLPGQKQLEPKKISDTWNKYRNKLKFAKNYQWYSLKDTGINNFLQLGIPTIDVKNQARHHSITQTEAYIPKTILKAVDGIKNANLNF
jgi:site-specific recombinase XerD